MVGHEFKSIGSNSSITVLPKVLEKIPVLLFAGDQDFICNYMGLESMIQAMTWNHGTGFGVRDCHRVRLTLLNVELRGRRFRHNHGV